VRERELGDRLIERLKGFILELGYGFCFMGRQMSFDFKKGLALSKLGVEVEDEELTLALEPFPVRGYNRIAVKVVNVYDDESTVVRDLA